MTSVVSSQAQLISIRRLQAAEYVGFAEVVVAVLVALVVFEVG